MGFNQDFFKKLSEKSSHEHTMDQAKFRDNISELVSNINSITAKRQSVLSSIENKFKPNQNYFNSTTFHALVEDVRNSSSTSVAEPEKTNIEVAHLLKNILFEDEEEAVVDFKSENYFEEISLTFGKNDTRDILNKVWFESYPTKKAHLAFLRLISSISYFFEREDFVTFAISAIANSDNEVKEMGVSLFEQWNNPEHVNHLTAITRTGVPWIDRYIDEVVKNISE